MLSFFRSRHSLRRENATLRAELDAAQGEILALQVEVWRLTPGEGYAALMMENYRLTSQLADAKRALRQAGAKMERFGMKARDPATGRFLGAGK